MEERAIPQPQKYFLMVLVLEPFLLIQPTQTILSMVGLQQQLDELKLLHLLL